MKHTHLEQNNNKIAISNRFIYNIVLKKKRFGKCKSCSASTKSSSESVDVTQHEFQERKDQNLAFSVKLLTAIP